MDLKMPGMNGIEATREIVATQPGYRRPRRDDARGRRLGLRRDARGRAGYLLKGAHQDEMLRAIRAVANGEAIFGPGIARRLMRLLRRRKARRPRSLPRADRARARDPRPDRARTRPTPTIAGRLFLSLKTVQNHVSNIFSKLQVADRAQAAIRAREAGFDGEGL